MEKQASGIIERLHREVPGLRLCCQWSKSDMAFVISGDYQCPCGEVSNIMHLIDPVDYMDCHTPIIVDSIKESLRRHVIGEGNKPNF